MFPGRPHEICVKLTLRCLCYSSHQMDIQNYPQLHLSNKEPTHFRVKIFIHPLYCDVMTMHSFIHYSFMNSFFFTLTVAYTTP
jgi:hypothetical protein